MAKPYRIISFSSDRFDQWRISESGGCISFKGSTPVFEFKTKGQYEKYLKLNDRRGIQQ
ncbi:hypothetical protein P9D18_00090 [Bacillus licheniformis]|uniref:hypothetical protein n=1 Tax=Bacillus TaxID=1386 RepID=UPI0022810ADF|nr:MULTISPECIES: hypothetical protein [Bacillus]MCY8579335.1 hypothetical protein [Bacillus haynesii]MCY9181300.1 hypothetical protein [Bacillus haynesii]MEC1555269.1 hypothetical protein [Bacillus licheniformis]